MNRSSLYSLELPWSLSTDDEKFKKILIALLLIYVVVALPIIFIDLPEPTRQEREQLPPQLARIMLEKQELPAPKPIEQVKPEEIKSEVKPPETKKPEAKKTEAKTISRPIEKPAPARPVLESPESPAESRSIKSEAVAQARERAANSGLMQFKDDLAEMRESLPTSAVATAATNTGSGGSTAIAGQVDRALITSGAGKGSGGVNTAEYSRDTGGTGLAGRTTTKVKSGLADASKKAAGATASGGGNSDGAGGAARSEEEVRSVMEKHRSALFNIYNKALRDDATLQGEVRVKLVIDPDGRIVDAVIVSSGLNSPELESKILQRIKLISFSASNVIRTTLNYSFNFVPQ